MRTKLYILTLLVAGLAGVNLFFVFRSPESSDAQYLSSLDPILNSAQAYVLPLSEPSYLPILDSNVPRPVTTARVALVYDVSSSRFLFEKNSRVRVPIASLTKILTAVVALEQLRQDDIVTITGDSLRVDGEKQDLYRDEQITLGNLIDLMLVESSNDAAHAIASYAAARGINFVQQMNAKARELDMNDSLFLDPAGLNDSGYSTAQDLAKLVRYALRHDRIWATLRQKEISVTSADGKIAHQAKNTNQLLDVVANVIGGKTGYTDGASGCLLLVVEISGRRDRIISIVLGSPNRFEDTRVLLDWVRTAYRWE